MSNADALSDASANTGHSSTAHPHALSAHGRDECFLALASAVDRHIDRHTSFANTMSITNDKFLVELGEESMEIEEGDASAGIVESQEVPEIRERNCTRIAETERYGSSGNLTNHVIRQLEKSNIPSARNVTKVIEGICKSKRKPDTTGIWDCHTSVTNGLWKGDNKGGSLVNAHASKWDEDVREGAGGKEKGASVKKVGKGSSLRNWKGVQNIAEFELKKKYRKVDFVDSISFPAATLDLKGAKVDSVKGNFGDRFANSYIDARLKNTFRLKSVSFAEMFRPADHICCAIVMERLVPLRYVKSVDHFKQAIREVVLANHLMFSNEWRILHRYISVDNLMVRYYDDTTIFGILIDHDLAEMPGELTGDHTVIRTRARLFMAVGLLGSDPPLVHLERFDWESFFYVICWIGCRYSEGKEVNKSILSDWYTPKNATLVMIKERWLFGPGPCQKFTPFYDTLIWDWIIPLQKMFYSSREARNDATLSEEFDEVTVGGRVTWDRFWEILLK